MRCWTAGSAAAVLTLLLAVASGAAAQGGHQGPARAARRRRIWQSRSGSASPGSSRVGPTTDEDAPPRPQDGKERMRAQLAAVQRRRVGGAKPADRRRHLRGTSKPIKPPYLPGRPQTEDRPQQAAGSAAMAAISSTRKPKTATAVPKFNDLYQKTKSKSVSKLLQQLANDPAAMRLLFNDWKIRYKKTYKTPQLDKQAFAKFTANVKAIAKANLKNPNYFQALNQYSDLSSTDMQRKVLVFKPKKKGRLGAAAGNTTITANAAAAASLPRSVDWRTRGKVSPVGDQGVCGSCYIWAATHAVESKVLIQSGKTAQQLRIDLSEGQLVDCLKAKACDGGHEEEVFEAMARKGVVTEQRYPYGNAINGVQGSCRSTASVPKAEWTKLDGAGYRSVAPKSATAMMQAVAEAPVAFGFAVAESFQTGRDTGIYRGDCFYKVNHAMTIVGYNMGGGPGSADAYWIIKNSWGAGWMDQGFVKVPMQADGTLGYCRMYEWGGYIPTKVVSYPGSKPGPSPGPGPKPKPSPPPPRPRGCADLDNGCRGWAQQGLCTSNADWMVGTPTSPGACVRSCGLCTDTNSELECSDFNPNCPYWASTGLCDSNQNFMQGTDKQLGICLASCGLCDGGEEDPSACSDWYDDCAYWAQARLCTDSTYGAFMEAYCPSSCQLCEDVIIDDGEGQCFDANQDCAWFAGEGYCVGQYEGWMTSNCPESCELCTQGCVDSNQYCSAWAAAGECDNYPEYMASNCPLSCGLCQPDPGGCSDSDTENCPGWASAGFCDPSSQYSGWMLLNCPASCNACDGGGGGECADYDANCSDWAAYGFCEDPDYGETMWETCPASCGVC